MTFLVKAQWAWEAFIEKLNNVFGSIKKHVWLFWLGLVVLVNLVSGVACAFEGKYNEAFLYILVAVLFAFLGWDSWLLKLKQKLIDEMLVFTRELLNSQGKMISLVEDMQENYSIYPPVRKDEI